MLYEVITSATPSAISARSQRERHRPAQVSVAQQRVRIEERDQAEREARRQDAGQRVGIGRAAHRADADLVAVLQREQHQQRRDGRQRRSRLV